MRIHRTTFLMIAVVLIGSAAAATAGDLGFQGAGGRLGYVDTDAGGTIGLGGHVEFGELAPQWALQGNLLYWSKSEDVRTIGGTASWSWSLFSIEGVAKYQFENSSPDWRPYAGGGVGLHFASVDVDGPADASDTKLGVTLLGGTNYAVKEGTDLFGEFRYVIISDFDYWSLSAGVTFWFGP